MPAPGPSAVRVALRRAMHVLVDPPPHVLDDRIGPQLAAPDATRCSRASLVARARFVEDLVALYFAGRLDALRPSSAEQLLVATT
jgi:hypothetical protein